MAAVLDPALSAANADWLLIGESAAMQELRTIVRQVAPTNAAVLLSGPSGSGKEVVARAVHAESRRSGKPFVAVNCGAIPRELLESELFGHEKGSFTGAISQRRGRFEEANCGTLFLDEIGDMPFDMQVKLLRVLEERTIQRVGGNGEIPVDVRIICATHRDIEAAIDAGGFREDLYYRLSVFPIDVPALAERRDDVPQLVRHFLAQRPDGERSVRFSAAAMQRLVRHDWPGNVRELRNVVERACILFGGQTMSVDQVEQTLCRRHRRAKAAERMLILEEMRQARLPVPYLQAVDSAPVPALSGDPIDLEAIVAETVDLQGPIDLRTIVADIENRYITEALRAAEGVVAEAARLLSMKRTTLIEKMRKHGVAEAA
jgi:sigma-54 specific flagellar transcriptional regulator A